MNKEKKVLLEKDSLPQLYICRFTDKAVFCNLILYWHKVFHSQMLHFPPTEWWDVGVVVWDEVQICI